MSSLQFMPEKVKKEVDNDANVMVVPTNPFRYDLPNMTDEEIFGPL